MFKKGDCCKFNESGVQLFSYISGSVGLIYSDKKVIYEHFFDLHKGRKQYFVYDLLVCGELFTNVPEDFIIRIVQNEKDTE